MAPAWPIFEEMLGYANHLGLYAEETGPSGEGLGNLLQAFTHLALISAAFNLDRAQADFIEVIAEATVGREVLDIANRERPALIFLDVRMPEVSGLDVARQIAFEAHLVFTTAYDKFAIAAFEIGALDYLVKPFGRARFQETLRRLRLRTSPPLTDAARARARLRSPPCGSFSHVRATASFP